MAESLVVPYFSSTQSSSDAHFFAVDGTGIGTITFTSDGRISYTSNQIVFTAPLSNNGWAKICFLTANYYMNSANAQFIDVDIGSVYTDAFSASAGSAMGSSSYTSYSMSYTLEVTKQSINLRANGYGSWRGNYYINDTVTFNNRIIVSGWYQ